MNPYVSIIIPSFNQGQFLERTIQSVLRQNCGEYELIIVDACSTDGTNQVIETYLKYFSHVIVERDQGQADAINKGVNLAKGRYVTWLNSDDLLLPGTLEKVYACVKEGSETVPVVMGDTVWIDKVDCVLKCSRTIPCEMLVWRLLSCFSAQAPSAFVLRDLWQQVGGLDLGFDYSLDTELWFRLLRLGIPIRRVHYYCWALRLHEAAKMSGHNFANSPMSSSSHPCYQKREEEKRIISLRHQLKDGLPMAVAKRMHQLVKILSGSYVMAKYDSIRMRGKTIYDVIE